MFGVGFSSSQFGSTKISASKSNSAQVSGLSVGNGSPNAASIATALIIIPLSITVGVLGVLSLITGSLAVFYTFIASLEPFGMWAISLAGFQWTIFSSILISFLSATVMLIIMSIVTSALLYIQNGAKKYLVPTTTQVSPKTERERINTMTPNKQIPLDEQIKQVTQESSIKL